MVCVHSTRGSGPLGSPPRCGRAGSRSSGRGNLVWARVSATGSAGGTLRGKVTGF